MRIRIKNFGPIKNGFIKNDGWIEIRKNTFFIGNQGSGKSSVAKLISTFMWIEKALTRGDFDEKWLGRKNRLKNTFLKYHRLDNYISDSDTSFIDYEGESFRITYSKGIIKSAYVMDGDYKLPQIMYVPSERNFIAYVKTPKELKLASEALSEFLTEFDNAKKSLKGNIEFPINNLKIEYDRLNDILNLKGEDYKIFLSDSSSGFQSSVPLNLVTDYLANSVSGTYNHREPMTSEEQLRFRLNVDKIWFDNSLTDEQKRIAISSLSSKFNKEVFFNIVEEPEQNLFPSSQFEILKNLVSNNNRVSGNKLIVTTHSPYLISYLGLMVEACNISEKIETAEKSEELSKKLYNIIPANSHVKPSDLIIYEMDENLGTIEKLSDYEGIPSEENYLNLSLKRGNDLFDKLLEIEEEL